MGVPGLSWNSRCGGERGAMFLLMPGFGSVFVHSHELVRAYWLLVL